MMKVLSVNIGLPRTVSFNNNTVTTGIFKSSINKKLRVTKLNLEGDAQADLSVHGGLDKAVYSYPVEHYPYWKNVFPDKEFSHGTFGENLTTQGLFEDLVNIGDIYEIGTTRLVVTQPRMPCYKLGIKFGRMDVIEKFINSKKPGIYFRVLQEGELEPGNEIRLVKSDGDKVKVNDIVWLYTNKAATLDQRKLLEKATKLKYLPTGWKTHFQNKLISSNI
jgi:MOSC domain-containing protein YiiM